MRFRRPLVVAAVAGGVFYACGGDNNPCDTFIGPARDVCNLLASIAVEPPSADLEAIGDTVTLRVVGRDGNGNEVTPPPNAVITWASSDPTVATVAPSGQTALVTAVGVGTADITVSTEGVEGSVSAAVTVTQVPAALVVTTQPGNATEGQPLDPQPVVEIRDANDNLLAGNSALAVNATIASGGGTLGGTTTVTAAGGVVTFTDLSITGTAGSRTLSFDITNGPNVVSNPFSIAAPPPPSAATSTVTASPRRIASGETSTLTLRAKDASGANLAVGGATVGFAASGGNTTGTISVTTDNGDGTYTATFTGIDSGSRTTISATLNGVAVTSTSTVRVTPGPAAAATSTVDVSSGTVASGEDVTLTLQAKDAAGNNVSEGGSTVVFSQTPTVTAAHLDPAEAAISGDGTISATTDNGDGTYTATFTGVTAGDDPIEIGATLDGTAVGTTLPTVVVTFGAAARLTIETEPIGADIGNAFTTQPVIRVEDAAGNFVDDDAGTDVTAAIASGSGGTLTGTATASTASGLATFTDLGISGNAGTFTLEFTAAGLTSVTSGDVVMTDAGSASPNTSTVTVGANSLQIDEITTLTLTANDGGGTPLGTGGSTVVFTQSGGTSEGTISATTDNGNGTYTATFTATVAGTPTTIGATLDGVAVTTPRPTITVTSTAASPNQSEVTVGAPTVQIAGSTSLTLQAKDAAGQDLTAGGATVDFTATGGTSVGTIAPMPATDNGNGTYSATFTGVTPGSPVNIGATIDGVAITTPLPTIQVSGSTNAPDPTMSTLTAQFLTMQVGQSQTITFQSVDALGTAVTVGGETVRLIFLQGLGTVTNATDNGDGSFNATDNANGTYTATLTALQTGAVAIGAQLNGVPVIPNGRVDITVTAGAADPAMSIITAAPATITEGAVATITLTAIDAAGVPLNTGGDAVVFSASGGGGVSAGNITPSPATDNLDGTYRATFQSTAAGTPTTISATLNGVAVTSTATIDVNPPSGGAGTISGVLRLNGTTPISGGTGAVQVFDATGTTLLATSGIDGSGTYQFNNASPSTTYMIFVHPPLQYSIDPADPEQMMMQVTTTANGVANRDVSLVDAFWWDDFQYTSHQDFLNNFAINNGGDFWQATVGGPTANPQPPDIELDVNAGPAGAGDNALRYSWPNRAGLGSYNLQMRVHWNAGNRPTAGAGGTYWTRIHTLETPGFHNGDPSVSGSESYKFGLQVQGTGGTGIDQMGMFINSGQELHVNFNASGVLLTSRLGAPSPNLNYPLDQDPNNAIPGNPIGANVWGGGWNTWIQKGGPSTAGVNNTGTLQIWINGVSVISVDGAAGDAHTLGPDHVSLGANINNGPPAAQDRWWREAGFYRGRPSMLSTIADVVLPVPGVIP